LYGWAGGALGIRQRASINDPASATAEQIALRWDWANVYIGSPITTGTKSSNNYQTLGHNLVLYGSMGIGTKNPTSLLQVGDDINSSLHDNIPNGVVITSNTSNTPASEKAVLELHSKNAQSVLDIESTSWGAYVGTLTNVASKTTLPLYIQQQGGNVFMGDVGKNSCNLSVNGNISWATSLLGIDQGGAIELRGVGNTPYIDFTTTSLTADYDARIVLGKDKKLNFFSNAGNGTGYVFNDASVGIGTTNTNGYKLAVKGSIIAQSIDIIGIVPASDDVFDKDYKLRTLAETEAYVNKNKHLPEVPSADEFKKGYSIGTMDDILLRKVEELTLYMIEMKKQNDALKDKVVKLEKLVH
jgi:hypothetical protein